MTTKNPHRAGQGAIGAEGQFQQRNSTASSNPFQSAEITAFTQRGSRDETACNFLRSILPELGYYVALIITSEGRKENRFATTIAELWRIMKEADEAGHTAYHASATFKEARYDRKGTTRPERRLGRTKYNTAWVKSLWADIDVGPEKPYADWREAQKAVHEFCRKAGLPLPLFVLSGLGLHIYWPLQHSLDRVTWERYAQGLKASFDKHGLHVDRTSTANIAAVLRTPGTHHRKSGVREVLCGTIVGPFPIDAFSVLLEHSNSGGTPRTADRSISSDAVLPEHLKCRPYRGFAKRAIRNIDRASGPVSGAVAAYHCEQLRQFRDKQGQIPEPHWYAGLCLLAHCDDGDRLAHAWSRGDPRYTHTETQERLDRAREFGPTRCDKFFDVNPAPCERCPHWRKITSPIQLGRNTERNCSAAPNERGEAENTSPRHHGSDKANTEEQQNQEQANGGTTQNPFPLRWYGEQDSSLTRRWLVKNMIPKTGIGLLSGQWGTYKTFIAIDLSGAIMTGSPFAGRPVKRKGGVLFLAAEGAGEMQIRICGLIEAKYPGHEKLAFAWAESCPTLTEQGAIDQLERIAKEAADRMQSEFGVELVLIVIDTMSAAAGFTDENKSSEGQLAMNALNELSKRTKAFVLACDHFGKAVETGTRGTSAKEAAADVVIACLGEKSVTGRIANTRLAIRKLRGGATGAETAYNLRIVDMGVDEDHTPVTTCVIEWSPATVAPPPQAAKDKEWPKSATVFRSALITALELHGKDMAPLADRPQVRAVELETVRQEFDSRYPLDDGDRKKQMEKRRQIFRRSRNEAQSRGLMGCREIDGKFMVWAVTPEERGMDAGHR